MKVYVAPSVEPIAGNIEQQYLALMPPRFRESALRYRRWQDRQATIFGKLLLAAALRACCNDAWLQKFQSLDVTPQGKPFIPGGPAFNISHSGDLVVLALARRGSIGIDIEKIRPVNLDDFSGYLPEIGALKGKCDDEEIRRIFFDCWTQKEAVLKGHGAGLSVSMEQVILRESKAILHGFEWVVKKLSIDEHYCCHLAANQPLELVAFERVNLMNGVSEL